MSHEVETMAYAGETPWHGLGFQVDGTLTPEEILKAAKLNWRVEKRPVFTVDGEGNPTIQIADNFSLVRTRDNRVLDIVGKQYVPIQNSEAFDFFTKFTQAGHMTMETAGSLMHGQYVWALAKVGKSVVLGNKRAKNPDRVESYLLMMSPHKLGKTMLLQHTAIRVVCWNTLNAALGTGLRGGESAFRFRHVKEFGEDVKREAEEALGLATTDFDIFEKHAEALTAAKATAEEVEDYWMTDVLQKTVDASDDDEDEKKVPRTITKFREALTHSPGMQLGSANGTWWGALNAVTFVVDHQLGRDRNTALRSAWLGGKARLKRRAFTAALKRAGVAAEPVNDTTAQDD